MALNIVPFALCLLFIYRCIYGFWTLYRMFTVELWTGYWILFHKILLQSYVVVAIHSLTVCTLYSLHSGYDAVMILVDRFGKRLISIPCYKTITAKEAAHLYIQYPYQIYGPPDTIISDHGPQFISAFWDEFSCILGIKLKLSTAYHPQTDGQTEIANQYLDQKLQPFVNYFQDNWAELLPMMDYAKATLPQAQLDLHLYN